MGIKLFSVGTGGLNITGEYILRQISQLTYAKYIFLTYGEKGESEGGKPGSVSHHTGSNFQTGKLEAIIIQIAKEELGYYSEKYLTETNEYFEAHKIESEKKEDTLNKLFKKAVSQLTDYSSIKITNKSKLAVLPFLGKSKKELRNGEYFTEHMQLSLSNNKSFILTERTNLQQVLQELSLVQSGLINETDAAKAGNLMGADIIILGSVFDKGADFELFLKLIRVETGEILSVTKLIVNNQLAI